MKVKAFITHKLAETFSDCQDRFSLNPDTKSIAVSDGMGSTWQQKIWAQLLVDAFTDSTDWFPTRETIKPLCISWRNKVIDYIEQLKKRPRTGHQQREIKMLDALIYRNERGLALGYSAGATFVGIRFEKNQWQGSVLGDSCLIEWDGSKAKFHTSQDVEAFDSYPDYFDSDETKEGKGTPKDISGILDNGNHLLLVSDPFSDFLLEHNKRGDIPEYINQLLKLNSHDDFDALVDDWRAKGMHNDDTTLVIVEDNKSEHFSIIIRDEINKFIENERKENEEQKVSSIEINQTLIPVLQDRKDNEVKNDEPNNNPSLSPADEEVFRIDFLKEYKKALRSKHPHTNEYALKWTQRAVSDAVSVIFSKYTIFNK
jgi:serine/threonine protein phosphatase PrpC